MITTFYSYYGIYYDGAFYGRNWALDGNQQLFLGCCWMSKDQKRYFDMYPITAHQNKNCILIDYKLYYFILTSSFQINEI